MPITTSPTPRQLFEAAVQELQLRRARLESEKAESDRERGATVAHFA